MLQMLPRKGPATRERILGLAESAVLEKGFAATSIEELIVAAGITKSGFFYHFKDKGELAAVPMQRCIAHNNAAIADVFTRADASNEDPLHGFLVALTLLAEMTADLPGTHPGCLIASFCYQDRLFGPIVRDLAFEGVSTWRRVFLDRLTRIAERYPLRLPVALGALADMANAIMDGGIVLSRIMRDKAILSQQIMLYRDFVCAVFLGV